VLDATIGYKHKSGLSLRTGVNNLTDEQYFTRRAGGYPGPGALPADGRTFFATLGFVLN
jgi:Fe(3+) dicitrate transport protein